MLVLSRKISERIVIGKDVVITVSQIRGNRVQLAIEAPQEVHILRGELDAFCDEPSVELKAEVAV